MYKETFSYVLEILTVIGIQCGVFLPNNNTFETRFSKAMVTYITLRMKVCYDFHHTRFPSN